MEKPTPKAKQLVRIVHKTPLHASQVSKPKKRFQSLSQEVDINVRESIERIVLKMQNSKIQTLHPPYFQKTLTKFRQQSYGSQLQATVKQKIASENESDLRAGLKNINQFITNFDNEWVDTYSEQIREPYIRKIFNEGYEIDKVNFKKLNSEYELRKQIEEVMSQTSEWLIQLEVLEDLLSRVELYFRIKTETIMEKLKTDGAENRKGSWGEYFASLIKKTTSYALRKGSRVVQNTGYASVLSPAFAMLTWAIIGGNSTLPWKGGPDIKSLIIPFVAFTVPYMLQSMAQTIERSDFKSMLQSWAQQFQKINDSIRHFNEMILKEISYCAQATSREQYTIHHTNLAKFVSNLSKQVQKVSSYDEETFDEMKERTRAYFLQYVEIEVSDVDGQWTKVMTPEQYEKYHKEEDKDFK